MRILVNIISFISIVYCVITIPVFVMGSFAFPLLLGPILLARNEPGMDVIIDLMLLWLSTVLNIGVMMFFTITLAEDEDTEDKGQSVSEVRKASGGFTFTVDGGKMPVYPTQERANKEHDHWVAFCAPKDEHGYDTWDKEYTGRRKV